MGGWGFAKTCRRKARGARDFLPSHRGELKGDDGNAIANAGVDTIHTLVGGSVFRLRRGRGFVTEQKVARRRQRGGGGFRRKCDYR